MMDGMTTIIVIILILVLLDFRGLTFGFPLDLRQRDGAENPDQRLIRRVEAVMIGLVIPVKIEHAGDSPERIIPK